MITIKDLSFQFCRWIGGFGGFNDVDFISFGFSGHVKACGLASLMCGHGREAVWMFIFFNFLAQFLAFVIGT